MENNLILIFIIILFILNAYSLMCLKSKTKENMSNTKEDIREIVNEVYRADVEAIRNLSDIADKLQGKGKHKNKEIVLPGNLTIRGNLKIDNDLSVNKNLTVDNNLTVNKNSNVKGQTTINQLYGGINGWKNWRTIKVNGGNLSFDIGKNKYAFNDNTGGIHFARSNKYEQLPINYGANVLGQVNAKNVYVNDLINTRRMDVRTDGKGTTHFNYANKGNNYIRGTNYIDHKSFFKSGAQFHGWSGWVTKNEVSIPSGYSSAATLIKGPNENGNIYFGSKYTNTKRSNVVYRK